MTGWNLPLGCNTNDIPGNSPEDIAYARATDTAVTQIINGSFDDDDLHAALRYVLSTHDMAQKQAFYKAIMEGHDDIVFNYLYTGLLDTLAKQALEE